MTDKNKPTKNDPVALSSYEEFGDGYAQAIESNAYNAHFERPSTLALLPDLKGKMVLDAGCGPGAYTQILLDRGAQSVVGLDVSPSMIKIAESKLSKLAKFYVHDLAKPLNMLEDSSVDFILSSLTVHYIHDQSQLFAEFNRVLKPGGQIVLSTHHPMMDFPSSPSQNYFQNELIEEDWNITGKPVRVRFYRRPLSEVVEAFTSNSFIIEKMTEGLLTDELEKRYPKHFSKLSKTPQFLFFRLRKES